MTFKRFIRIAEDGSVIEDKMTQSTPKSEDWIEIPREQMYLLGMEPHRLRWDKESGLSVKTRIRLSVGAFSFPADGESEVAIGVRGEALSPSDVVPIKINGQSYDVTQHNDIYLTSETPGDYIVKVISPHYYTVPGEVTITALEVIEDES